MEYRGLGLSSCYEQVGKWDKYVKQLVSNMGQQTAQDCDP